MAQLAIKGHATRGKEVIEILEMLGGSNTMKWDGVYNGLMYFINNDGDIDSTGFKHSYMEVFTLEEFLEKFPYRVGDKVYNIVHNENQTITSVTWDCKENVVSYQTDNNEYVYINYLQPYKEETMEEDNEEKSVNHVYDTEVISFDIAIRNSYELDLKDKFHVVLREGKYYVERIKPQYPKTYVECAKILDCFGAVHIDGYKGELLDKLQELIICSDAYWKIAGKQMGLGKPWKPDWTNNNEVKFTIGVSENEIIKCCSGIAQYILAFPTEEMRDAFYENFKNEIEECKELL